MDLWGNGVFPSICAVALQRGVSLGRMGGATMPPVVRLSRRNDGEPIAGRRRMPLGGRRTPWAVIIDARQARLCHRVGDALTDSSRRVRRGTCVWFPSTFREPADDRINQPRRLFVMHRMARAFRLKELAIWDCARHVGDQRRCRKEVVLTGDQKSRTGDARRARAVDVAAGGPVWVALIMLATEQCLGDTFWTAQRSRDQPSPVRHIG